MNSIVFITGATSGIGKQLALDYAASGWRVIACGRNETILKELSHHSSMISTLKFDVTDYDETQKVISSLSDVPDIWIFNAGNCEYMDNGKVDAKLMARVLNVNVIGVANCVEACQRFFERGHKVVMVGSIASEVALPRAEAYGASKAAVSYFARALALDLHKQGIDVVTVFPGFVETPLTDKNDFEMPMIISVEEASESIRKQLSSNRKHIYFPAKFTSILRFISLLPYSWQARLTRKLLS